MANEVNTSCSDYFATWSQKYIQIHNKTKVKLKTDSGYGTSYGALQFDCRSNLVHKWQFSISKKAQGGAMAIGIDDSNGKYIEEYPFGKKDSNNYCYWSRGQKQSARETATYNQSWADKDKILMIFNGSNGELSFNTTTGAVQKAFNVKKSDNKYMMCVYIEGGSWSGKGDSISLTSYSCSPSADIEEKKDASINIKTSKKIESTKHKTEISTLKSRISSLEKKIVSLQNDKDEMRGTNESLQTKNDQNKLRINELKTENSRQRTKIVSMEKEFISIRTERDKMQKENMQLQQQNNRLLDEKKEYEMKINELKDEISKLKLKCIDVSKYETWKCEEIIAWIMSLDDGRFKQYYDVLLQNLKEEGIEGSDLSDVNEIDLKSWGVKNFKDKKLLLAKLKELTQQNIQNNFKGNNIKDEGAPTAYI